MATCAVVFSVQFAAGVALGGALSILGFHTLHGHIRRLLTMPAHKARVTVVVHHYARLGLLFGVLALTLVQKLVNPLSLLLGLSVVLLSLLLTTFVDWRKIQLEV